MVGLEEVYRIIGSTFISDGSGWAPFSALCVPYS